jgi:hypothetical protein
MLLKVLGGVLLLLDDSFLEPQLGRGQLLQQWPSLTNIALFTKESAPYSTSKILKSMGPTAIRRNGLNYVSFWFLLVGTTPKESEW